MSAPRFIIRIDDCGWTPDKEADTDLAYYRSFREAAGLDERPVPNVAAFIPRTLTINELAILHETIIKEQGTALFNADSKAITMTAVGVHGWDHVDGAVVTARQMAAAFRFMVQPALYERRGALPQLKPGLPFVYVAPWNRYGATTFESFKTAAFEFLGDRAGAAFFLGGFPDDEQSFSLGENPVFVDRGFVHVPAHRDWYARAHQLIPKLEALKPDEPSDLSQPPIVLTLHVTWEVNHFGTLRRFFDLIAPFTVDVNYAADHLSHLGKLR